MANFSWATLGSNLANNAGASLSRRIDNELNSDFMPSPNQPIHHPQVVKTADSPKGRAKVTGTGSSVMSRVPTGAYIGGGVALVVLIAIIALK